MTMCELRECLIVLFGERNPRVARGIDYQGGNCLLSDVPLSFLAILRSHQLPALAH